MVSPAKPRQHYPTRTSRTIHELAEIHFRQHVERASWRSQLETLKRTLETTLPVRQEPSESAGFIEQLQKKCRILQEDLDLEREQSQAKQQQLEEELDSQRRELSRLNRELHEERRRRAQLALRTRELLKNVGQNKAQT